MLEKKLPIAETPVRGYMFYAFPVAIVATHQPSWPWIHSNFIQTCFDKDLLTSPVPYGFYLHEFSECPWLHVQRFQRHVLQDFQIDIVSFLMNSIERDQYVYLYVDEFYIPDRVHYQSKHYAHEILVTGFNREKQTLSVLGFNKSMQFASSEVSFVDFIAAYNSIEQISIESFKQEWGPEFARVINKIYLYELNLKAQYKFNLPLVIETLEDYLYSRNTSRRYAMTTEAWDRAYGMSGYAYFKKYFEILAAGETWSDIRYLANLLEHKSCMTARIRFMEEQGNLDPALGFREQFQIIEDKVAVLRNIMLRAMIAENITSIIIEKIIRSIDPLAEEEAQLLYNLIDELKKHPESMEVS